MFSVVHKAIGYNAFSVRRSTLLAIKIPEQNVYFSSTPVNLKLFPNKWSGLDYLRNPHLNKDQTKETIVGSLITNFPMQNLVKRVHKVGLGFTMKERQYLGIQGLLAGIYKTQEEQIAICRLSLERYQDPLNRYMYLSELLETNERLFYSLIASDVEKYLPIVYTPTVGLACQNFGYSYNKPKGLFITINDKGRVIKLLKNWPNPDVCAIVVTDGERILGLGDLGAFGMGIPIGKLSLYTALAGVKPYKCLPVLLDVGCNNESLLVNPLYIGLRQKRVRGKEYDEFVEEFMQACVQLYGRKVLIQFEDFAKDNAVPLLARYRDYYCTFNDDIQGTAAIVVAGLLGAVKISRTKISENIFLFLGAGAAGVGVANLLVKIMMEENLSKEEAEKRIYLFDVDGLVTNKRSSGVPDHAKHFSKDMEPTKDFLQTVANIKATTLIGASTVGGAFTPDVLKQMAKNTERPVIFALSNPTSNSECTAQQAYDNTEGRCIFASGSPFPPVKYNGKEYTTGQGNNAYIFPGVGLGVICCQMNVITDDIFVTAAKVVAKNVTEDDFNKGRVYPSLDAIRQVSMEIAKAVIDKAYETNIAGIMPKPQNIDKMIEKHIYNLAYPCYIPEFYDYPETSEYKPADPSSYKNQKPKSGDN